MKRQRNTKGQQKTAANGQHFHVYSDDNSNKKSRVVTFSKKKLKINDVTNRQPNIQQQQKIVTSRVVDSVHWGENDVSDVGGQLFQPNINEELKAVAKSWGVNGGSTLNSNHHSPSHLRARVSQSRFRPPPTPVESTNNSSSNNNNNNNNPINNVVENNTNETRDSVSPNESKNHRMTLDDLLEFTEEVFVPSQSSQSSQPLHELPSPIKISPPNAPQPQQKTHQSSTNPPQLKSIVKPKSLAPSSPNVPAPISKTAAPVVNTEATMFDDDDDDEALMAMPIDIPTHKRKEPPAQPQPVLASLSKNATTLFDDDDEDDDEALMAMSIDIPIHKQKAPPLKETNQPPINPPAFLCTSKSKIAAVLFDSDDDKALMAMPIKVPICKRQEPPVQPPQLQSYLSSSFNTSANISTTTTTTISKIPFTAPPNLTTTTVSNFFPERSGSFDKNRFTSFTIRGRGQRSEHNGDPMVRYCATADDQYFNSMNHQSQPTPSLAPSPGTSQELNMYIIILKDLWLESPLKPGDTIHIVWDPEESKTNTFFSAGGGLKGAHAINGETIIVDQYNHWLVIQPYQLLSPSNVGNATTCLRDAVLRSKMKDTVNARVATLGNLKHDLFEQSMLLKVATIQEIYALIPSVIMNRAADCYASGISDNDAQNELHKFAPLIVQSTPGKAGHLPTISLHDNMNTLNIRIDEVVNSEERIMSRMWGITARPDLTVKIHATSRLRANTKQNKQMQFEAIAPFELKTGKAHDSHRVQTLLYMLACADRYQPLSGAVKAWSPQIRVRSNSSSSAANSVPDQHCWYGGVLLNLNSRKKNNLSGVPIPPSPEVSYIQMRRIEMQSILKARNALAVALEETKDMRDHAPKTHLMASPALSDYDTCANPLPPVLERDQFTCNKCYARDICMLHNASFENSSVTTSNGVLVDLQAQVMNRMVSSAVTSGSNDNSVPKVNEIPNQNQQVIKNKARDECIQYYRKWTRLLNLEDRSSPHHDKNLWTLSPEIRESLGTCASNLQLTGVIERSDQANIENQRKYILKFQRRSKIGNVHENTRLKNTAPMHAMVSSSSTTSLIPDQTRQRLDILFQVGDRVMISIQGRHMDVCHGSSVVRIGVDHLFIESSRALPVGLYADQSTSDLIWCVDKTSYRNAMAKSRTNVRHLLLGSLPAKSNPKQQQQQQQQLQPPTASDIHSKYLRNLLVHMVKPEFHDEFSLEQPRWWMQSPESKMNIKSNTSTNSTHINEDLTESAASLNESQKRAISHVLRAKNYSLMWGMPGTGKTTTIVFLIRVLLKQGFRLLLSAFTNSAVDNVLLKLKEEGVNNFVRIGNRLSMKPDIRQHSLHDQLESKLKLTKTEDQMPIATMETILNDVNLVAATCLGARDQVLCNNNDLGSTAPPFDYCIVDEASQIHEPVCIGPLLLAKHFVLVGDPNQLSAVVVSRKARDLGMSMSLFERLASKYEHAVSRLTDQYRMNRDINLFANDLVYSGALHCGSTEVELRTLSINSQKLSDVRCLPLPEGTTLSSHHWMKEVLCGERSVVFINTDSLGIGPLESRDDESGGNGGRKQSKKKLDKRIVLKNEMEVCLTRLICRGLIRCGISQKDVGVMSPYRSQLKLLSRSLQLFPQIEVNTVDQYQGRDKECIVFSLVRSNSDGQIGILLKDWRRINVAISRAKSKLIILGSLSTLEKSKDANIVRFVQSIQKHKWVLNLPKDGHRMYPTL
jgi:hypothetical protein